MFCIYKTVFYLKKQKLKESWRNNYCRDKKWEEKVNNEIIFIYSFILLMFFNISRLLT